MEVKMLFNEGSNEVVAVVIPRLHAELEVEACSSGSVLEERSLQEILKVIRGTSVTHSRADNILGGNTSSELSFDDSCARIFFKSGLITSEIFVLDINTESRRRRVRDRSKSRARGPSSRFHGDNKGTISSHGVSHNRSSVRVNGEEISDETGEFFRHVGEHVEVFVPGFGGGIAVMPSSVTNFPVLVAFEFSEIESTRRSIREDHSNSVLFGILGKSRFLSGVVLVTSESR
jgi:hypothetical protein